MINLICPNCSTLLTQSQNSLVCHNNHSFDIAKEGYVNLHINSHKSSNTAGDTPESLVARRNFLNAGFYDILRTHLQNYAAENEFKSILDVGCGEGYYTHALGTTENAVIGLDIAKKAVQMAAKQYKNITWLVGSSAHIPVANNSINALFSIFSPLFIEHWLTKLNNNGQLIIVKPAPNHLQQFKTALFTQNIAHENSQYKTQLQNVFETVEETTLESLITLNTADIANLILMTPYAYKAKPDNITKLKQLNQLQTTIAFEILIAKNKKEK